MTPHIQFSRFDRVKLAILRSNAIEFNRRSGVIIWCDWTDLDRGPFVVVELDTPVTVVGEMALYCTCLASELESLGAQSCEENHVGRRNEVSFDTGCGREGCFRTLDRFWEAYFIQESNVEVASVVRAKWRSGIMGNHFVVPLNSEICQTFALTLLQELIDANPWSVIHGPDSLILK